MEEILWQSDPDHSRISFRAKHLMFTNVLGEFRSFSVKLYKKEDNENFNDARAEVVIDAGSIYTNSNERDNHLRSSDFFDVENNKEIYFSAYEIKVVGNHYAKVVGELTIKGIKGELILEGEYSGIMKDPQGNSRAGFSLEGKIIRKNFNLAWNTELENGGLLISEDIKFTCDIELMKVQ